MPVLTVIDTEFGVQASYWRVMRSGFNHMDRVATSDVGWWVDYAAYEKGDKPLVVWSFRLEAAAMDASGLNAELTILATQLVQTDPRMWEPGTFPPPPPWPTEEPPAEEPPAEEPPPDPPPEDPPP